MTHNLVTGTMSGDRDIIRYFRYVSPFLVPVTFILIFFVSAAPWAAHSAQAPEHYYNPSENLNPDPNYTPGEWPLPEPFEAKTLYQVKKSGLIDSYAITEGSHLFTLGAGEITFSSLKNETARVLGYFRNYTAVAKIGEKGPERMEMLIDINSLDTGVPGRNNRILEIFFRSMEPDFGTASVVFDEFDLGKKSWKQFRDGKIHTLKVKGTLQLNNVTNPLSASLDIQRQDDTWMVETRAPIQLFISDYAFGDRVYELMKSCNHASLGNRVEVKVELYLR